MNSIVYNENCIAGMKRYKDKHFNLAIVDPPYNIGGDSLHSNRALKGAGVLKNRAINKFCTKWDNIPPSKEYFIELMRISVNQIIWGGNYFNLGRTRGFIIWDKQQPFENFSACEYAWTSFDKPSKIYVEPTTRTNEIKIHPTQKSVKMYEWLLHNYANEGDLILDTHLGSGSSRIACHKYGFDFTGFELDKEYFEAQEKRFNDFVSQLNIF